MNLITKEQFIELLQHTKSTVIKEHDTTKAPKVLTFADDEIIKIFYPKKKWLTSNWLNPRAKRFARNAIYLKRNGVHAPEVTKLNYCPELKIHVLHYKKISGQEIRTLVQEDANAMLRKVIIFIANLHEKGIFFRSIHLGNIIYCNEQISLIDITDVRFKKKPLNYFLRLRNLKHLLCNREDRGVWKSFGSEECLAIYFEHTHLSAFSKRTLSKKLLTYLNE